MDRKTSREATLIADKLEQKVKNTTEDKDRHYQLIKCTVFIKYNKLFIQTIPLGLQEDFYFY